MTNFEWSQEWLPETGLIVETFHKAGFKLHKWHWNVLALKEKENKVKRLK